MDQTRHYPVSDSDQKDDYGDRLYPGLEPYSGARRMAFGEVKLLVNKQNGEVCAMKEVRACWKCHSPV